METNSPIRVKQVENGFTVSAAPESSYRDTGRAEFDETLVFQSFAELSAWLANHFEFRTSVIRGD